jgi:hypothetical protein
VRDSNLQVRIGIRRNAPYSIEQTTVALGGAMLEREHFLPLYGDPDFYLREPIVKTGDSRKSGSG